MDIMAKQCGKAVDRLSAAVDKLPDEVETKELWIQQAWILSVICGAIDDIYRATVENGDGSSKLDDIRRQVAELSQKDKTPERTWFIKNVLPGLIQNLITVIVVIFTVLAVLHYYQIFQ